VDGYITATVNNNIPLNSSFAKNDRLRFDFQIRNVPVTTNSGSINEWRTTTTTPVTPAAPFNRIFSYFSIGKCAVAASSDNCSNYSSILTAPINYSTANNIFSVAPTDGSWTTTSAPEQVNLVLRVFANAGQNIGMQTTIGGATKTLTLANFGGGPGISAFSLPIPAFDWLRIGNTNVSPTISSLTAENIIQNIGVTSGYTQLSPITTSGRIAWGSAGSDLANLNVNGISLRQVPGPVPLLGSLAAFAYSRKLRSRIRAYA